MTVLVRLDSIVRRYPGTVALDSVSAEFSVGEVVGLIGQNGSGKTTMLKILGGVITPDSGTMTLRDRPFRPRSVNEANAAGVGIVFQEQSLVGNLTVAENIFLGKRGGDTRGGFYRWNRLYRSAQRQLDKVRCDVSPKARVETLTFAQRQMVELAKVLALEEEAESPLLILFDEPTSVLNRSEVEILFTEIRRLREHSAVVFVSHRFEEVLEVSDRVIVMSDGRKVAERVAADTNVADLYRLMVGSDRADDYYLESDRPPRGDGERLVVQGLSARGVFAEVSFTVPEGSVLGVLGLVGSGREDLCRALCGALPVSAGSIRIDGQAFAPRVPADAVAGGVGYVPAERKLEGIIGGRSIIENLVVSSGRTLLRGNLLVDRRRDTATAAATMSRLQVRASSPHQRIDHLSGGNQQKVTLGKWLLAPDLRVLVLDHPTRGLDLAAKADVYRIIRELTGSGLSVLLISDTLEETLGLSDQLLVMRDGRTTRYIPDTATESVSQEALVELMS